MKQRKPNAGRHVAIERGLHPNGAGWPFRRELRQLSVLVRAAPVDPTGARPRKVAETRLCEA
jgi:hypothetical protein